MNKDEIRAAQAAVGAGVIRHERAIAEELADRLATATELLRRVVMDYAPECDPWFPPCTCSAWAAREFLAVDDSA